MILYHVYTIVDYKQRGVLAQSIERSSHNREVPGSKPGPGNSATFVFFCYFTQLTPFRVKFDTFRVNLTPNK